MRCLKLILLKDEQAYINNDYVSVRSWPGGLGKTRRRKEDPETEKQDLFKNYLHWC